MTAGTQPAMAVMPMRPEMLSPAAYERALRHHGGRGRLWVRRLPELAGELCGRWQLRHPRPRLDANRTCVIEVCWRDEPHYLKIHPNPSDAHAEQAALLAWQPTGRVPTVRFYDPTLGALLLPTAGDPAAGLADLQQRAQILAELHRTPLPPDHRFPSLAGRVTSELLRLRHQLACGEGDRSALETLDALLEDAHELLSEQPHVLLHTDPRGEHWVRRDDALSVIGPQPATGPADYDLARLYADHQGAWCQQQLPAADTMRLRRWLPILAVLQAARTVGDAGLSDGPP